MNIVDAQDTRLRAMATGLFLPEWRPSDKLDDEPAYVAEDFAADAPGDDARRPTDVPDPS